MHKIANLGKQLGLMKCCFSSLRLFFQWTINVSRPLLEILNLRFSELEMKRTWDFLNLDLLWSPHTFVYQVNYPVPLPKLNNPSTVKVLAPFTLPLSSQNFLLKALVVCLVSCFWYCIKVSDSLSTGSGRSNFFIIFHVCWSNFRKFQSWAINHCPFIIILIPSVP